MDKWFVFWTIFAIMFVVVMFALIGGYAPCSWYDINHINNTETQQVLETCFRW